MIDTHCHIDGEEFVEDIDEVIARAREAGVQAIGVPGINLQSLDTVISVCKRYPNYCYPMLGLHPEDVKADWQEVLDHKFVECGLCGTAAVISPIGRINDHGTIIDFPSGMEEIGPVMKKMRETLLGIQMGEVEAPEGWIMRIL